MNCGEQRPETAQLNVVVTRSTCSFMIIIFQKDVLEILKFGQKMAILGVSFAFSMLLPLALFGKPSEGKLGFGMAYNISRDHSLCANAVVFGTFPGFYEVLVQCAKISSCWGGSMGILFEICEKRPFPKCMGWGGGKMITFLSKRSCKVDDAQVKAMLEGPLIILNRLNRHCCPPLPQGQGPHWGTHPPACEFEHFFFSFSQSCSLRALTGTPPLLRGMAHRPSVVRSTLRCLVSRTLRHAVVSVYPDFTKTKSA